MDNLSIEQLSSDVVYHINFKNAPASSDLQAFVGSLRDKKIKAILTVGEVTFENLSTLILDLPAEYKEKILMGLQPKRTFEMSWDEPQDILNPLLHEQSK